MGILPSFRLDDLVCVRASRMAQQVQHLVAFMR